MPYIREKPFRFLQLLPQGMEYQHAFIISFKIAQLILSAYIYPIILVNGNRTYHCGVRKGVNPPISTVKAQQTFIVSKIHDPFRVLGNTPVLQTALIDAAGIIENLWFRNCALS